MGVDLFPLCSLGALTKNYDSMRVPVKKSDRNPGPYPYYGASGIVDYVDSYIFDGEYLLLAEDGENLRSQNLPISFMATGRFWVNNHAHILKGKNGNSTRFLCYALKTADIRSYLSGSTRPKLTQKDMKRIPVSCPNPNEQRAIAHILGTLDDKIELNRRMNATLEGIARAIFKSWFVDFDPVHAKAEGRDTGLPAHIADLFPSRFVDSELGPIPEGWEVGTIKDEFRVTMGQSPPGSTYNEEGMGLPFHQGRTDFGFRFPSRRRYCSEPNRIAEEGDTLVSVRAPVGDTNIANERICIGRGVAAVRHRSGAKSYTYYSMKSLKDVFDRFEAEGTVFGSIGKRDFNALSHSIPSKKLIAKFEKSVCALDTRIHCNEEGICLLTAIRDSLLPKLISGEMRVPNMDLCLEEVNS